MRYHDRHMQKQERQIEPDIEYSPREKDGLQSVIGPCTPAGSIKKCQMKSEVLTV